MKNIIAISILFAASTATAVDVDPRIDHIADRLTSTETYSDSARFVMSMQALSNDVAYNINLNQRSASADTLAPCSYIVRWSDADRGRTGGFTAYFDGNLYRFAGRRMSEFHAKSDTTVFHPSTPSSGMQQTAQFANLLPAFIGTEIKKMAADPEYTLSLTTDTIVGGRKMQAISAIHRKGGFTGRILSYVLDPRNSLPLSVEIVNNPGAESEQSISVTYSGNPATDCPDITEESLATMFPDAFGRYRSSRMDLSRLVGSPLPGFSLPTTTGERYTRSGGDPFRRPTLLAIIDDAVPDASATVEALRSAIEQTDDSADLILAFTGNNIDRIESLAPDIRPGEHLLISARGLARDCGASVLPAILVCGTDASIVSVLAGFNNKLSSDVIEKMQPVLTSN